MVDGVKLRLVYFFYADNNYKDSITNKFHFECWKKYFRLFDEMTFVISLNKDITDRESVISDIEKMVIDCSNTTVIKFKVEENDKHVRECNVFRNEIVYKLSELDGITFFAHSKGVSNIHTPEQKDNILQWIFALYYLTFNYIDEVVDYLVEGRNLSYGPLLFDGEKYQYRRYWGKNKWMYTGTFFGINCQALNRFIKSTDFDINDTINTGDRWEVENFLPNIYNIGLACCHNFRTLTDIFNFYEEVSEAVLVSLGNEYNDFLKEYKRILSNIENRDK